MLAGQPEKEVSKHSHLTPAVDERKYMLASLDFTLDYENGILSTAVWPQHHVSIAVQGVLKCSAGLVCVGLMRKVSWVYGGFWEV